MVYKKVKNLTIKTNDGELYIIPENEKNAEDGIFFKITDKEKNEVATDFEYDDFKKFLKTKETNVLNFQGLEITTNLEKINENFKLSIKVEDELGLGLVEDYGEITGLSQEDIDNMLKFCENLK